MPIVVRPLIGDCQVVIINVNSMENFNVSVASIDRFGGNTNESARAQYLYYNTAAR